MGRNLIFFPNAREDVLREEFVVVLGIGYATFLGVLIEKTV